MVGLDDLSIQLGILLGLRLLSLKSQKMKFDVSGWAYARNTPNSGPTAAVFEHEIGRWRVRSLFTKQLLYH